MHYVKAKGILSSKNGMNLYRGCSHGCIYCDSRSKCYHMEHGILHDNNHIFAYLNTFEEKNVAKQLSLWDF